MVDLQRYYKRVHEIEAEILATGTKWPLVMSVEDESRGWKGGTVSEVSTYVAGQMIVAGSHRLATLEEIDAYKAELERRREASRQADIRSGAKLIVEQLSRTGISQHMPVPAPAPEPSKKPTGRNEDKKD